MSIQDSKIALYIDAYQSGTEVLAILKGRLVLENCETARKRLQNLLTEKIDKYYLYLGRLEFADSAGWGALVGLKMAANRNRTRLIFLSPTQRILDIFRISKLDAIFEIMTGAEAEIHRSSLVKRENLLWRDTPDESQNLYNTEVSTSVIPDDLSSLKAGGESEKLDQQKMIDRLSRDAVEHIRHGDYQKAIDLYQRVLDMNPEDLSALNNLGVVYEKKPEWYADAGKIWRRVLELSEKRQDFKHADRARKHLDQLAGYG